MKKIISVAAAAVFACICLTGCTDPKDSAVESTTDVTEVETTETETVEETTDVETTEVVTETETNE